MPGPVPKRTEQRRRRNKTDAVDSTAPATGASWPEPDEHWHEIAQSWFRSLGESGQAEFFEPSDVQTARYVATAMSQNLTDGRFSSMMFAAVMSASSDLLATEGARRRLRVELSRTPESEDPKKTAAVSSLSAARARMENRAG